MKNSSLASFTANRARLIIDTLHEQGVTHFCLSPGSRSSALALAIGEREELETCVHFDERGLGFYALGLAKSLSRPVVLLVTTGTAAANLFPSLMEAHLSRVPLIVLTADRPPELRDCGSNQTADHVKIFSSFVRWEIDLALSDPLASDEYITSSVAYAAYSSQTGPVHINCMIREPFISFDPYKKTDLTSCIYEPQESTVSEASLKNWGSLLSSQEKGVILLGSDALQSESDLECFLKLAEKLNWPIFSDIISGGRKIGNHPCHIEHFELLLKAMPDVKVDTILQIGNRFVSKTLMQWVQKQTDVPYFLTIDHEFRQDPLHKVTRRMKCKTDTFCKNLIPFISPLPTSWVLFWKTASEEVKTAVAKKFCEDFSEPSLFAFLKERSTLPIYLSSSMPVRDADLLFYPEKGSDSIFCNRGASGIDGNIATAAGVARGLKKPLIAVLGDLATLHDLNSLSFISQSKIPMILIVINNQGGGIFSFLPISEKKELFESFIATSHDYDFKAAAETFSISYNKVTSYKEWEKAWEKAGSLEKSVLIEYSSCRTKNLADHQNLYEEIKNQCFFMKPLEAAPL